MTSTKLSSDYLEKDGWMCGVVERWIPQAKRRIDLFGFLDMVCIKKGQPMLGIQATASGNATARIRKITDSESAKLWLSCGYLIEVHDWVKRKKSNKRILKRYGMARTQRGIISYELAVE